MFDAHSTVFNASNDVFNTTTKAVFSAKVGELIYSIKKLVKACINVLKTIESLEKNQFGTR